MKKGHYVLGIDDLSYGSLNNLKKCRKYKNFEFKKLDITNLDNLLSLEERIDCVFHLAALISVDTSYLQLEKYFNVNVLGTYNVINYVIKNKINKIIYSASASCYADTENLPINETWILDLIATQV